MNYDPNFFIQQYLNAKNGVMPAPMPYQPAPEMDYSKVDGSMFATPYQQVSPVVAKPQETWRSVLDSANNTINTQGSLYAQPGGK